MDLTKQKAIASCRAVDNLRLLIMACIEGASETSRLLYEQLIATEMNKLEVDPRDFFQTIINILKKIRDTFPRDDKDTCWQQTVETQFPELRENTPTSLSNQNLRCSLPNQIAISTSDKTRATTSLPGPFLNRDKQIQLFREIQNHIVDKPRISSRLAIKKERFSVQDESLDEEFTDNPNFTIRRIRPIDHSLKKVKMERITPKAKRPRGRPLNNSKQVKIIDQAGKQHMKTVKRGRPVKRSEDQHKVRFFASHVKQETESPMRRLFK